MKILYIIRGLPGSGKSTLAKKLVPQEAWREADMYFVDDNGNYCFDPEKISAAHQWCTDEIERLMVAEIGEVCVSNTFTRPWEYKKYVDLASRYGYTVQIIKVSSDFPNVHGVTAEIICRMKDRWQE